MRISSCSYYYKWCLVILTTLLFFPFLGGCGHGLSAAKRDWSHQAIKGTLDLRGVDWSVAGRVRLEGEWGIYWNELLSPEALSQGGADERKQWTKLPDAWNKLEVNGKKAGAYGHATYRLKVLLDESPGHDMALHVPFIRTAYSLWVNGRLVAQAGQVGTEPETSVPKYQPQLVTLGDSGAELDIVLQVSNYHHRLGGPWQSLEFGEASRVIAHKDRTDGLGMMLVGSMIALGLHHLGKYALRRKDRTPLYFGWFCLFVGVHALFVGDGLIYLYWPELPWRTALFIEYLCFYLGLPAAVLFVRSLYPGEVSRRFVQTVAWGGLLFVLLMLALPMPRMTELTVIYQLFTIFSALYLLYGIACAALRRRGGALLAIFGTSVYAATVIIEVLYYNQMVRLGGTVSYGLLIVVFTSSFILSDRSSKALSVIEKLSKQMRELNMGLESKIRERTAELEKTNRSLERMNDELARLETSRRHLLTNISHDLGTPMTLIQGYVEALLDGVVTEPEQQNKYLRIIHNRITGLNRLISDLFQLSKLEARQMDFEIQPMRTKDFMRFFKERYELEVLNEGLRFQTLTTELRPQGSPEGWVRLDVDRINQVLTNIIYNAVRHTPRGGLIQLHMIVDEHSLVVQVQDNGPGIDPEDLPYIFDRFYKKDKSRNTAGGGSGLGLAIAKEIVDFHGGRIWAQSRKGQGACIAFMLPLAAPPAPRADAPNASNAPDAPDAPDYG